MYNLYNPEADEGLKNFLKSFRNFLVTEKAASITQRSYVSDVKFFLSWLIPYFQNKTSPSAKIDLTAIFSKINQRILADYGFFLIESKIPLKSINRKYSALRKLGTFCQSQNLITENIFEILKNLSIKPAFPEHQFHLGQFKDDLVKRGLTKITIKNYLGDTKQFLAWPDSRRLQTDSH